jgi:hypothetical protein
MRIGFELGSMSLRGRGLRGVWRLSLIVRSLLLWSGSELIICAALVLLFLRNTRRLPPRWPHRLCLPSLHPPFFTPNRINPLHPNRTLSSDHLSLPLIPQCNLLRALPPRLSRWRSGLPWDTDGGGIGCVAGATETGEDVSPSGGE